MNIKEIHLIQRVTKTPDPHATWFDTWSWQKAPQGHSNDPKRRFLWLTWKESYAGYKYAHE